MKKWLSVILAAVLALALCACNGASGDSGDPSPEDGLQSGDSGTVEFTGPSDGITDTSFGEPSGRKDLSAQEFAPGEQIDNLFYKRATNPDDNTPAYLVTDTDGNDEYLPMGKTVIYVDENLNDAAYYERVPLEYKLNGETVQDYQYQLTTSAYSGSSDITAQAEPAQDAGMNPGSAD